MKNLGWVAGAAICSVSWGQTLRPSLTAIAIVGAKIETRPGKILEKGTVLMRDGLIVEVGEHVAVPPGAQVVDGKGLFVYAGFMDGGTSKGLKKPEGPRTLSQPDISQDVVTQMRWGSPKLRPDLSAASMYQPDDEAWKGFRSAGFTTAVVMPADGILRGTACLVNLDGGPRRESVITSPVGMSIHLATGGGEEYPGTELGAYSAGRQTLYDAQWYRNLKAFFNSENGKRPPDDPTLESVLPILSGESPAIIEADEQHQIDRAIDFATEFNLRPVIFGGLKAFRVIGKLRTFKAPVVAALNWSKEPVPEKEEPKKEDAKKTPAKPSESKTPDVKFPDAKPPVKPGDKAQTTPSPAEAKVDDKSADEKKAEDKGAEEDEPKEVKEERERLWLEIATNAWVLTKAGIPVAFTTRGAKDFDTFFANLRRAVKLGMPREQALAGLTLNVAKIYGVERQLGAIEAGKIANLTVLSADFLDPKAKAKFVFIDGKKFEIGKSPFTYSNAAQDFKESN